MSYTVVTTRIDPETKRAAQKTAHELGMPLSVVIKGFIKQFIRTKSVNFSLNETPNEYLIQSLKQSDEDIKKGRVTSFKDGRDALVYLDREIENEKRAQAKR